ncbi:MAG: mechanosensitive ion channel family protein [Bacteroidetes bacterium]|nr:MAG: mechanosensitive ion channel family protein [Bacteroidota bacterium]
MQILYTIIVAIALAIFLRAGFYFLKLAARKKFYYPYIFRFYPWLEVLVWTAFIFWAVYIHFSALVIYPVLSGSLAVIFILVVSWFVLRDFISGAVLRADHGFYPGNRIKTDSFAGTIVSLGYVSVEILTSGGERIKVPYSNLTGKQITRIEEQGQEKNQNVKLKIPQKYGAQNIQQMLRKQILELPWIVAGKEIKIELAPEEDKYIADITFQSVKDDMLPKTEELLKKFANSNFPEK